MLRIGLKKGRRKNVLMQNLGNLFRKQHSGFDENFNSVPNLDRETGFVQCEAIHFYNTAKRLAREANELADGIAKILCHKEIDIVHNDE